MTLTYPIASNAAHPPRLSPGYKSTVKRSPQKPLIIMRHTLSELTGPVYGHETVRENDHDLTTQHVGEPLGERIIVHGHVLDEDGRGVQARGVRLEVKRGSPGMARQVGAGQGAERVQAGGAGETQDENGASGVAGAQPVECVHRIAGQGGQRRPAGCGKASRR